MPPLSSLAGILDSPVQSSNGSTLLGQSSGRTLPDISLGSLGSSFHSADDEEYPDHEEDAGTGRNERNVNRRSTAGLFTPLANPPASALLNVSPTSVRRANAQLTAEGGSQAPLRSRYLRREESNEETPNATRFTSADLASEDDEGVLNQLSVNVSHRRTAELRASTASTASYGGGPSKRSGRHSVAGGNNPMTLREQEQNVDALQKENFNLQLENHFLKERLASMAPDHIEAALKENVKLKIEILNLSKELKKAKKLLSQQDRDLNAAARERDGKGDPRDTFDSRQLEAMFREEKERRQALEAEIDRLRDSHSEKLQELEEDLDAARGKLEDQALEMANIQEAADRAEDEADKLREETKGLNDSVGIGKGREARLVQKLEQDNVELKAELEELRAGAGADVDELEDQVNQLRDKLASVQIDVERRDDEIDELNNEIDLKVQEHEKEIQQVEAEWRDEVIEARAQADELKDVLQEREADLEDIRKLVLEREDELLGARERIIELESAQAETAERLEDTLRNIEQDNAEKEADLVEANREVEALGQRVYELEEAIDEMRAREAELTAELQNADEEKQHFEDLVSALKEARRKAHEERDEWTIKHQRAVEAHESDRQTWESERTSEAEQHRRALANRDQVNERLTSDLEAARERVAMKDRDLVSVQNLLRDVEDEHRKIGDERTSDQRSLELEIDRLRRDLLRCEDELERARDELREREQVLHQRDMEVANVMDKHRDVEAKLATERQGRLTLSDKLDAMTKTNNMKERELNQLRDRLSSTEPQLKESQHTRSAAQRDVERQKQERTDLLVRVFKGVNRFLEVEDKENISPSNFPVFRDTLLQRVRSISGARGELDKRVKDAEVRMEQKMGSLKRQLDAKWRALDGFEASVKKLELARTQWRTKYAAKEGELEAAKARCAELQKEVTDARAAAGGTEDAALLRSLTERAQAAEKRATQARNDVSQLEARLSEIQNRSSRAEEKWEARVKEYENRLRIANEKVKTEKQGGKERVLQLEKEKTELQRRLDITKEHNRRAEGVVGVAHAAHLMDK